jgi:hypothetical protein
MGYSLTYTMQLVAKTAIPAYKAKMTLSHGSKHSDEKCAEWGAPFLPAKIKQKYPPSYWSTMPSPVRILKNILRCLVEIDALRRPQETGTDAAMAAPVKAAI